MTCRECQGSGKIQYLENGHSFQDSCFECDGIGQMNYSQIREQEKDYLVDFLADHQFLGDYSLEQFQEAQIKIFGQLKEMDCLEPESVNFLLTWLHQIDIGNAPISQVQIKSSYLFEDLDFSEAAF